MLARSALAIVPAALALHGSAGELSLQPDGSLLIPSFGPEDRTAIERIAPDGKRLPDLPLPMLAPETGDEAIPVLTGNGGAGVVGIPDRRPNVTFAAVDSSGAPVGTTETIPGFAEAYRPDVLGSPAGAVVVIAYAPTGNGYQPQMAFRPPGGTFGAHPVPVGATVSARTLISTNRPTYSAVFAPDGSGILLTVSPVKNNPSLRRISPTGAVSASIPIRFKHYDQLDAQVALGPDGTAVVAMGTVATRRGGHGRNELYTTSLAPGATAVGPVRDRGRLRAGALGGESVALSVDATGHVVITGDALPKGLALFEGTPTDLRRTVVVGSGQPSSTVAVPGSDGGLTLIWESDDPKHTYGREALVAVHRAAGGAFGSPRAITAPVEEEGVVVVPDDAVELPGGDVAVLYSHNFLDSFVTRFTP